VLQPVAWRGRGPDERRHGVSIEEVLPDLALIDGATDVSRLGDLEARLRAFEDTARLAAIVNSSQDAIIGKTLDGVITSWNSGAQELYGYAADEIVGHNIAQLMPEDRASELKAIIAQVARGELVEPFETRRVAKNGKILEMSVAISPIRDEYGVVTGASTVARDITEMKRARANREALEAQLHRAQRLESLGQLAGGVAHDFNNLLAGIMNYAGLVTAALQEELNRSGRSADPSMTTIVDDVEQITKAAKRAADLTRQLLIFSRREVLRPQVLDVNAVIVEVLGLVRRAIGQTVDHVTTALADDLPSVTIDRGQIEQVIMNLAINARDAMSSGGTLGIATSVFEIDRDRAQMLGVEPGTYVQLSVSDTGTGMTHEVATRAFEPFFTTKATGEGTGLGLATVFGIVTQAGGDVSIISEVGRGTTVDVHLPATLDAAPESTNSQPAAPPLACGETILLVEDEAVVREPVRRMLARAGYAVLEASSTDEALEIVRGLTCSVELLVTDVVMPGRSGKELADEMHTLTPATKVLFMSGYSENVIVHHGVPDDGLDLIEKPFSTDDLLRRVRKVLDREA
jgi:two-component system, cell cycle sensor histidine kinase and response regulator CckA